MVVDHRHDWYLKEWLEAKRLQIKWFEEQTGWTHRITSQLVNRKGTARWNRDHLSLAASILHIEPWELMMHPDEANELKRIQTDYRRKLELAVERQVARLDHTSDTIQAPSRIAAKAKVS